MSFPPLPPVELIETPPVELVGGVEKRDLVLEDHQAGWPEAFASHERRIREALGPTTQVEHIGSTSVPGHHS
nr:GrpB family protein [Nocardioides sp. zg-DK7169]